MKICFVIPFHYLWGNYSNVKSHYDYLRLNGYEVDLFSRAEKPVIDYNSYDQIWLMGAGSQIDKKTFDSIIVPVFAFGWSDPNLFSEDHYENCDIYFTNDLKTYTKLHPYLDNKIYYYQTTCNKLFHKNLKLSKTTDILVYGCGDHKFIPNRNEVVNKLRRKGFNIKIFGREWNNHTDTHEFIEGQGFIEEINKTHIVLDITNDFSAWGHRIFESSACGTPCLTYDREDTRQILKEGMEILLYKNIDDIIDHLKWAKQHLDILKMIGFNAQQRCYKENDISIRIQELLKIIKENV